MTAIDKTRSSIRVNLKMAQLIKNEDEPEQDVGACVRSAVRQHRADRHHGSYPGPTVEFRRHRGWSTAALTPRSVQTARIAYRCCRSGWWAAITAMTPPRSSASKRCPCTIIMDPDFDEEREKFQLVRMNVIRGKMDPDGVLQALRRAAGASTSDAVLQETFGFAEDAEFKS